MSEKVQVTEDGPLVPPKPYENPKCTCCGREEELRMGWCFDCCDLQSMLIEGSDMYDRDCSSWKKSELLAHIVRTVMAYKPEGQS